MYNGIGLQTARGSGTNGYIQTNKFFVKPKTNKINNNSSGSGYEERGITRKPNEEILEHDRKRQIQLKLLVLEDKLIEQGYTDDEISVKLDQTRCILESAADASADGPTKVSDTQTHQVAARKQKQMENLKSALGIVHEDEYVLDEKIEKSDPGFDGKDDEKDTKLDEPKRDKKKKTREASSSSEDSDSDSESEREVGKSKHRKKTRGRSDDESDSDSDVDIRKNKRKPSSKGSKKHDRDESEHVGKEKRLSSRRSSRRRHGADDSDDDAYDVDKYERRYDIDDRWDGGSSKRDTSPIRETRYEKERRAEKTGRRRHDTDDDEESDKDIHHNKHEIERGRREEKEVERGGRRRHDVDPEGFNKKDMARGEKRYIDVEERKKERVLRSRHDSDDDDIPAKEKVEKGDSRKRDSRNEEFNNKEMTRGEKRYIDVEERKNNRVERSRHDSDDDDDDHIPTKKKVERSDSRKHDFGNQEFNNKEMTRGEKRQRDSEQGKKEKIESSGRGRYSSDDDDDDYDVRRTKQKTERGGGSRQEDEKRMMKIPTDRDERSNKNKTTTDHGEEKHLQDRKEIRDEEESGVRKYKRDETYEKREKGRERRPSSYRRDHEEEHGSKRTKYDSDKHDVRRSRH